MSELTELRPNRGLAAAVLNRAIQDVAMTGTPERERDAAREWLKSDDTGPGSLAWWCGWIDVDPDRVRDTALSDPAELRRRMKNRRTVYRRSEMAA